MKEGREEFVNKFGKKENVKKCVKEEWGSLKNRIEETLEKMRDVKERRGGRG